jgi:hypothetical protein
MLAQRKLLAEQGSPLATDAVAVTRDLGDTAGAIAGTWRLWRQEIARGSVRAAGIDPGEELPDELEMTIKDPCRYCEFKGLCRVAAAGGRRA